MATKLKGNRGIKLTLRHPAYQLDDDDKVVIGGTFKPNLDAAWYTEQCALAAEYGVDPYLFIGFSIVEYGGYRVGEDHEFRAADRGLAHIATGRKFVTQNGASGTLVGDALHTGVMCEQAVQQQLKALGAEDIYGDGCNSFSQNSGSQKKLDRQSFILLKQLQTTALQAQHREYKWSGGRLRYKTVAEPSIAFGLQSLHGFGTLPYLYAAGHFGDGKLVRYSGGRLVPTKGFDSGLKGSEHPVYGFTLATFIHALNKNPEIRAIVPQAAEQRVAQAVNRDFAKVKVRGLRPVRD